MNCDSTSVPAATFFIQLKDLFGKVKDNYKCLY